MIYSIKTASILLKNKTHAIYDDNGDVKTLRKVLKKAFPEDKETKKYDLNKCKNRYCLFDNEYNKVLWWHSANPKGLEIINLSEITKKPKMKPETFTISKEDYDKFKQFELDSLYTKYEPERRLSRDEFAVGAMNGYLSDSKYNFNDYEILSKKSYCVADAMIKQRDL